MATIEERAKAASGGYDDDGYSSGLYMGYVVGATAQKAIDIGKACEWLEKNLPDIEYITNASAYRQSKSEFIDTFRKAMEEEL